MRTKNEINSNITSILNSMDVIKNQIDLLEKEYQTNFENAIGYKSEELEKMSESLKQAWNSLNQLWHMENDYIGEIETEF
jgi:archaellum component FlaC